jgi:transcription termination/antitermination protein NusG
VSEEEKNEETAPAEEPEAEAPAAEEAPAEEAPAEEAALETTTAQPEQQIEEPAPEVAAETPPPAEPSGDGDRATEVTEAAEEEEEVGADPYGGPGDWYVIHTYAGYENKVKTNLASRIQTMQMQDKIFDVVIPMEDVMEIKGGRKQVVQKKVFPGYLLVKMIYDDESWFVVRNTPGVTGFVSSGTGQKPTPLSRREVERILGRKKEEAKPAFRLDFEVDDVVRIISGPFADFNGTIAEINLDQSKVKVMVNIFDRETPVELGFDQVARV